MKTYYVYILKCADNSYYTGVTNDIGRRVYEHERGIDPNCFTFKRRPVKCVFVEHFDDVEDAIKAEKQIKGWKRNKKEALIAGDYGRLVILSHQHGSTSSP